MLLKIDAIFSNEPADSVAQSSDEGDGGTAVSSFTWLVGICGGADFKTR